MSRNAHDFIFTLIITVLPVEEMDIKNKKQGHGKHEGKHWKCKSRISKTGDK